MTKSIGMNIQQLEYIIAVDQFKSFSKAADYCNITQATLSTMVKKIEQELDVVIFDRKSNQVFTTDNGLEIIKIAKKSLGHINQLKDIAQNKNKTLEGKVKIGIIPTVAGSLLPIILRSLIEKYPNLYFEIIEITTASIIKSLKTGDIDIGIISTPSNEDGIEEEILYYESLMIYGDDHGDKKYKLTDNIQNEKVWLLESGNCLRDQFLKLCSLKKNGAMPKNLNFEANSFETLLSMVDEFGGLTLIPELYYKTLSQEKMKKVSFFESPIPVREISIVYYRPFSKQRIIFTLSNEIRELMKDKLISSHYKNNELVIVKS